jgi:DNA-binding transcriptional regulator YhcF (GntR family)
MMVVLANHPNWQVYPDEIAKRKGVNRKTIDKYFKIFEEAGYLRKIRKKPPGNGGSHIFRFFSDVKISDFQFDIMKQRLNMSIKKASMNYNSDIPKSEMSESEMSESEMSESEMSDFGH